MLRITQQASSSGAKRYYASADYYSEGQEIIGLWGGRGARLLGLEGVVDKESFERLCDNLDPRDGRQLTVRVRSDRTVGYDFTFSVPKSVSVLYAMTGDREILDAFRSAVDETMRDIELEMKTRVRKGGKDEDRVTGNAIWAEFIHTTSRPVDGVPDPQLHAHCFMFNSTWDMKEGRWKAGQFRGLKADAPYFQAAFRVRLANKLQDLGFGVERKRDDFEIAGVPLTAIKRFSRRTEKIEQVAAEKGITDPKRKAELGAETREKKNKELSWDELRREWDSQLTDKERQAVAGTHRRDAPFARPVEGEKEAVDYAVGHSFARESVVSERKLQTEAMKRGVGSVTVEGVKRELAHRPLIWGWRDGREMATSKEMIEAEARVIAFARDGRGKCRPLGDGNRPCHRDWLNDGQKAVLRQVLSSRDLVTMVRGPAGTGKTTLQQELADALKEAGKPVVAIAPTTSATQVLQDEAGFADACTVARFFKDTRMQAAARGGLVLVDESSLLGTRDMLQVFELAKGLDARVLLVGDTKQHRSVSAGEPLRLLEERAGVPVATVTEVVRQSGNYKKAARALSEGRTEEAFAVLDKLGWITEIPHAGRYVVMGQAYLAAIGEKKKSGEYKTALVVSPTHAEGNRITMFIRNALKAAGKRTPGKLGEERQFSTWIPTQWTEAEKKDPAQYEPGMLLRFHQNAPGHKTGSRLVVKEGEKLPLDYADRFEVYRPGELPLAVGERVRVTAKSTDKSGKHKLANGALYTVQGFTSQGDPIIDHGWVLGKDDGLHLAHGYCVTSHAAQGRNVEKVFIGLSSQSLPAANQRSFYVPVTRGREQAMLYTDDKKELLRAVQRPDEPLSAMEFVQTRRHKPNLRQRFKWHLGLLRRLATLSHMHEPRQPDPQRTPPLAREKTHVR